MFDRLSHLNSIDRSKVHDFISARDAVSLLLVDRSTSPYKLLMGRRPTSQVFMPDVFVFPGGAVETSDHEWAGGYDRKLWPLFNQISPQASELMVSSSPSLTAALLRCGVRETFEETGLDLYFHSLFQKGLVDEILFKSFFSKIVLLSRAITPPGRKRRFDTRFYVFDVEGIDLSTLRESGELNEASWVTYSEALELPLHVMTRVILEDVNDYLQQPILNNATCAPLPQPGRIAFYQYVDQTFCRRWLEMQSSP